MFTAVPAPITPCPGASLAREASSLLRRMQHFDETKASELLDAAVARLTLIEGAVARLHCSSAEGLMFQACVAYGAVTGMVEAVEVAPGEAEGAELALRHLALSLATAELELLVSYYMPRGCLRAVA